jgi:hypothetical protein
MPVFEPKRSGFWKGGAGHAVCESTLWRTRGDGMRVLAEVLPLSVVGIALLATADLASIKMGHGVREVASNRERRPNGSRTSPTTFTTTTEDGAALLARSNGRVHCAECCMKCGTWMLAPLMALGWAVSAAATVRIHSDPGGRIDQYIYKYNQIRLSGQRVIVDGTCNSACTLLLGSIPRDRICFTDQASLGFHAAWQLDDAGRPVESPAWTRVLWRNYPRAIRSWITNHGGLTPHMIFLRGEALSALYPRCTTAARLDYQ